MQLQFFKIIITYIYDFLGRLTHLSTLYIYLYNKKVQTDQACENQSRQWA